MKHQRMSKSLQSSPITNMERAGYSKNVKTAKDARNLRLSRTALFIRGLSGGEIVCMAAAVVGDFDAFMLMLAKVSLAGADVTLQCLARECAGGLRSKYRHI